jgi:hypothetical protein
MANGNDISIVQLNADQLNTRLKDARDSLHRAKDSSSEGAAIIYLIYRDCHSDKPREWLLKLIEDFNDVCTNNNKAVSDGFDRAKKAHNKTLPVSDKLMNTNPTPQEQADINKEMGELATLNEMDGKDRRKLRMVPGDTKIKEGPKRFNAIVKAVLEFDRESHSSMVSRYCMVIDWIDGEFHNEAGMSVQDIKAKIAEAGGFFRCAEIQRDLVAAKGKNQGDQKIITAAIDTLAQNAVNSLKPAGLVDLAVEKQSNGFVLVIGRMSGSQVEIVAPADVTDGDIDRAVKRLGNLHPVPADPEVEFVGRVLRLSEFIKDRVSVAGAEGSGTKVKSDKTDKTLTIRSDKDGEPMLVVSVNRVEAAPVLHAKPAAEGVLTLGRGEAVMQGSDRRKLEREILDEGRRPLYALSINDAPLTDAGKASSKPLVWELKNRALEEKGRATSLIPVDFVQLRNVTDKPIDVDRFTPQFSGLMDIDVLNSVYQQLLVPWEANRRATKKTAAGANKKADKKAAKQTFAFELRKGKLTLKCGDADPMIAKFHTKSHEIATLNLRIADIHALFKQLKSVPCKQVSIDGDTGGLMRFAWFDQYGQFSFYVPTMGTDGKLQSRRVAPMQARPLPLAAE